MKKARFVYAVYFLAAICIVFLPQRASATTWYSVLDDSFPRSNTSVAGVASSTSGVGNNWTDTDGNVWNISSNLLQGTSNASSDYLTKFLLRPSSENSTGQRIVATIPAGENISGEFLGLALRWQSSTFNYYLAHIGTNGLFIYKIIGGSTTLVQSQSLTLNAAHSFLVDFSATGTSPTNINLVVTDLTSSSVVGTIVATDSAASLQTSGSYGLTTWYNSGAHFIHSSRIQTYNDIAPNNPPDAPTNLGPTALVNGTATSTTQPQFSFTLSDPDVADVVRYEIQIDDTADFSSPVIDYTFPGGAQGSRNFQVGQSGGSGATYIAGHSGQTLSDGSYYWRVRASDGIATSSYSVANGGAIAFVINTAPPAVQSDNNNATSVRGGALPWCSGPFAPGWNVSLPGGGCGASAPAPEAAAVSSPASTTVSACPYYRFSRTLKFGDTGEDVRSLQKFLNCAGFSLGANGAGSPGNETQIFSGRTLASLKAFQAAYAADILIPAASVQPTGIFSYYSQKKAYGLMLGQ